MESTPNNEEAERVQQFQKAAKEELSILERTVARQRGKIGIAHETDEKIYVEMTVRGLITVYELRPIERAPHRWGLSWKVFDVCPDLAA